MGLLGKTRLEYFYLQKNSRGEAVKYGPYSFEQLAQVYRELQIDMDSYVWTSEKCIVDAKGKQVRPSGWTLLRDMPQEFIDRLTQASQTARDRREKLNTGETSFGARGSGVPPPVPSL